MVESAVISCALFLRFRHAHKPFLRNHPHRVVLEAAASNASLVYSTVDTRTPREGEVVLESSATLPLPPQISTNTDACTELLVTKIGSSKHSEHMS